MITELQIEQSLYTWLQTTALEDDFQTGNPDRFDPNRTDTQEWLFVRVGRVKQLPMHGSFRRLEVTLNIEVNSRDQNSTLGASSMVDKIITALTNSTTKQGVVIPIKDYATTGDPQIGTLEIQEYESVKEPRPTTWQTTRLTFSAVAQSLT